MSFLDRPVHAGSHRYHLAVNILALEPNAAAVDEQCVDYSKGQPSSALPIHILWNYYIGRQARRAPTRPRDHLYLDVVHTDLCQAVRDQLCLLLLAPYAIEHRQIEDLFTAD